MNSSTQLAINVDIPIKKINQVFKWVIVLDIIFLCGTALHHSKRLFQHRKTFDLLLMELNLGLENVAAAWYSSMLLFLVAVVALLCFVADQKAIGKGWRHSLNIGWLVIVLAFAMLSFDEMGSFHESIGSSHFFKNSFSKVSGWVVFYVAGGLMAIFMAAFFLIKFRGDKKALCFSIAGFLLLLSNPFQEKFEHYTWDNAPNRATWHRPVFFLIMEEGSELLASLCFLFSFTIYAVRVSSKDLFDKVNWKLKMHISPKSTFIIYLIGFFILMALSMYIIHSNAWHLNDDDLGRPQNWFPSVTAFAAFLIFFYGYCSHKKQLGEYRKTYLGFAINSLIISCYFGADIYNYRQGLFSHIYMIVLPPIIIMTRVGMIKFKGLQTKVALAACLLFMLFSVFTKEYFITPLYGFIGFCLLIITFYLNARNEKDSTRQIKSASYIQEYF